MELSNNLFTLILVAGHSNVAGNEMADMQTKEVASLEYVGPEPFCAVSLNHIKFGFQRRLVNERIARLILGDTPKNLTRQAIYTITHS